VEPQIFYRPEVEQLCRISRATIYRLVAAGKFPAPIRVGFRRVAWRRQDLEDWLRRGVESVSADS